MAKKFFSKAMSVGLTLALSLGMIVPAFAADAYFYIGEEGQKNWQFVGQGYIEDELAETLNNNGSKQELTLDGFNRLEHVSVPWADAPEGTTQTITAADGRTEVTADTSLIDKLLKHEALKDGYVYNDSNEDVLDEAKTYTVTWTASKADGADAKIDENGNAVPKNSENATGVALKNCGNQTVHVDGTLKKSDNTEVKVVVKNAGNEEGTEQDGTKYVRDSVNDKDAEAVKQAASAIVAALDNKDLTEDNYKVTYEGSKETGFKAVYEEKTYNVTYEVKGSADVSEDKIAEINGKLAELNYSLGKVTESWNQTKAEEAKTAEGAKLKNEKAEDGSGTYEFSDWTVVVDEDGNVKIIATCTFNATVIEVVIDDYFDIPVEPEVVIDETAIPLSSGPITRAEFIDYLWRHENEPEGADCTFADVAEDHDYVLALGWAEQNEVAFAYDDGNFEPDKLVTAAAVREFLDNFASVFGTNAVAADALTTLTGEDGEAVLNCGEVLAEFFGEEYASVKEDGLEMAA